MAAKKQQHLQILVSKKEQYFARIQRLFDNSQDVGSEDKRNNFQIRYKTLETTKTKFLDIIDEINLVQYELDANHTPDYAILEAFDELVCHIESVAEKVVAADIAISASHRQPAEHNRASRLPNLPLPKFNGEIKDWPLFIECYNNMIHNNSNLNDVDRVHYLISCLKDSALSVCSGIPPTGDNYGIILQALIDKYEDKRTIANSYLEQLFNFKQADVETADSLNTFLEKFHPAVTALFKLSLPNLADYILAYIAFSKLNPQTQRLFENTYRNSELPSYEKIIDFVKEQAKICSRTTNVNKFSSRNYAFNQGSSSYSSKKAKDTHTFMVQGNTYLACVMCKDNSHLITKCSKFLGISPVERYNIARNNNLCLNCLSPHRVANCRSNNTCRTCHLKHHTLLHFKTDHNIPNECGKVNSKTSMIANAVNQFPIAGPQTKNQIENSSSTSSDPNNEIVSCCSVTPISSSYARNSSTVLLSTVKVHILNKFGDLHEARFLLDSGSQGNMLSVECCRRIKLDSVRCQSAVRGIGTSRSIVHGYANIVIISQFDKTKRYSMEVLIVDRVTDRLPTAEVDVKRLPHLTSLQLADREFYIPQKIDGIIGANLFAQVLGTQRILGTPNAPIAVETEFGFVVMGSAPTVFTPTHPFSHSFYTTLEPPLEKLVKRFWEIEDIPSQAVSNPEDSDCERIFKSTYSRDSSGRYTVALPFKMASSLLGDSRSIALRRFFLLEKKLASCPNLKKQYAEIIQDYIKQGHMSKVAKDNYFSTAQYYIPHHAVFKTDSTTTPVRIVFDASCRTDSTYSLNDLLFTGSKLQTDVCTLFLNFRLFEIAITADIRQMYRQINLVRDHRRFQQILWRFSSHDPIETYELNTVSFGVRSSPFLALRTIHQLAEDEQNSLTLAAEVVKRDMYVDDLVSSIPTVVQATLLYHQLTELFRRGAFHLTKWATNSPQLLEIIPEGNRTTEAVKFETDSLKILGLQWHPNSDMLSFSFKIVDRDCTKRNILSTVARCYDPLGFLAPVTLLLKLLVKELWIRKLDWDEIPPPDIVHRWNQLKVGLPLLLKFEIPRYLGTELNQSVILIGFADACLHSFGSVVYLRSVGSSGNVRVHLLCAKSKVSPMKVVSIPRLELCAAHLLSKLFHFIVDCYKPRLNITKIYALSDSTVTLNWIATHPCKLQTFVANRVAQIQSLTDSSSWFHVDGKNNISDCLSRGLTPLQFVENATWKTGPEWLTLEPYQWPIRPVSINEPLPESKVLVSLVAVQATINPFRAMMDRMSKWTKVLRSVVYVLRFLKILPITTNSISSTDIENAEFTLVKMLQAQYFPVAIITLKKGICPPELRHLRPFWKDGIIRVGGRLANSDLDYAAQHPILLPKRDRLVELLIDHYHCHNLHTGPHLVLSLLRLRYWILSARSIVRSRIKKCNICFRLKPKPNLPIMGNLPSCRVQQVKAFMRTGCDYAGPVQIIPYRKRGIRSVKAYICLFVCMATKALHLELVTDLSTDNFLQAFKRFIGRRGVVAEIYTDNGTNFIGAKSKLADLYKLVFSSEYNKVMHTEFSNRGIQWKMIPPGAPHIGGLWESNVRSVKTHLYKMISNQLLTYEEFNTLLVQIESLLNSRPLCVLSSDPADPIALTPGHFLTFGPTSSIPNIDLTKVNINRLTRFQMIDRMVQDFWKRWRLEYLTSLQSRQKWNTESCPVHTGTVVVMEQPNTPPLQWPLGIIEKVYPGRDNIVRVVDVRTKYGTYKRPVIKVCPLPLQ